MEAVPRLPMISFPNKESTETVDIGTKLKRYIRDRYNEDPESYNNEIYEFESLRRSAINAPTDFTGCSTLKRYYCQLRNLSSRFPKTESGIGLSFKWSSAFDESHATSGDVNYEMHNILYNIATLHMELGSVDSRTTSEGMKISCTHFQCAAWAFQSLNQSLQNEVDLNPMLMNFMVNISLSQAQECILEKSMTDSRKPNNIAKVSMQVVEYLRLSSNHLENFRKSGSPLADEVGSKIFKNWQRHIEFKVAYYQSVTLFHQGLQSEEQQKMGERIAFFQAASDKLEEATKLGKTLEKAKQISEAMTFANDVIRGKLTAAQKENEFVYHEKIPPSGSLSAIKGAALVKGISFDFNDPEIAGADIFGRLVPMEAHQASSMYSEEKAKLRRRITSQIQEKNDELETYLTSMQLDSLAMDDNLDTVPQELVDCCAELNARDAVKELTSIMSNINNNYHDIGAKLSAITTLTKEEDENEKEFRLVLGTKGPPNQILLELKREADKYREAHKASHDNNMALHEASTQHKDNISVLSMPLDKLLSSLPSVASVEGEGDVATRQEVQRLLKKVKEMQTQRTEFETKLKSDLQEDDVTKKLVTNQRDMEVFFKDELQKHSTIVSLLEQNMAAQCNILQALSEANAAYATTRRLMNQIKSRRGEFVSSLLLSYNTFIGITVKAENATEFYSKLEAQVSKLFSRVKSVCKVQEEEREEKLSANVKKLSVPGASFYKSSSVSGPKLKDYLPPEGTYGRLKNLPAPSDVKELGYGSDMNYSAASGGFPPSAVAFGTRGPYQAPSSGISYPAASSFAPHVPRTFPQTTPVSSVTGGSISSTSVQFGGSGYKAPFSQAISTAGPTASLTSQSYYPYSSQGIPHVNPTMPASLPINSGSSITPASFPGKPLQSQPQQYLQYHGVNCGIQQPSPHPTAYPSPQPQVPSSNVPVAQVPSIYASQVPSVAQGSQQYSNYQGIPQGPQPVSAYQPAQTVRPYSNDKNRNYYPTAQFPSSQPPPNPQQAGTQIYQANHMQPTLQHGTPQPMQYPPVSQPVQYPPVTQHGTHPTQQYPPSYYTNVQQQQSYQGLQQHTGNNPQSQLPPFTAAETSKPPPQLYQNNQTPTIQHQNGFVAPLPTPPHFGNAINNVTTTFSSRIYQYQPNSFTNAYSTTSSITTTVNSSSGSQPQMYGGNHQTTPYHPVCAPQPSGSHPITAVHQPVPLSSAGYGPSQATSTTYQTPVAVKQPLNPQTQPPAGSSTTAAAPPKGTGISNLDLLSDIDLTSPASVSQWCPLTPLPVSSSEAGPCDGSVSAGPDVTANLQNDLPNAMGNPPKISAVIDLAQLAKETKRSTSVVDPLTDDGTLNALASETERLSKFVQGFERKSLNGPTNIELKWKELTDLMEQKYSSLKVSVGRCYPLKNRFADILPFDHTRVILPSARDDYINASSVQLKSTEEGVPMILTQAPMANTFADFWTMVWENQVETIVSLNTDAEVKGQVYIPQEINETLEFGNLTLTLKQACPSPNQWWIRRIININEASTKISKVVLHLQFLIWPPSAMPESPGPLLQFLAEVHNLQKQQRNKLHPMIVHCVPGTGRSGVFAILSSFIKYLHVTGTLADLWNLVVELSQQRRVGIHDRTYLLFLYSAALYYAQEVLMKRGILTDKATFEEGPREKKTHVRHPSADLLSSDLSRIKANLGLDNDGSGSPELYRTGSQTSILSNGSAKNSSSRPCPDAAVGGPPTSPSTPDSRNETPSPSLSCSANVSPSHSTDSKGGESSTVPVRIGPTSLPPNLAAILDPDQLKLDKPNPAKPKKITKESFLNPIGAVGFNPPETDLDPLSGLDPLWNIKKN